MMECHEPSKTPPCPVRPGFQPFDEDKLPIVVRRQEFGWLLGRTLSRTSTLTNQDTPEIDPTTPLNTQVPVWSAYNSHVYDTLDVTRKAVPPLIPSPAHEWSTLLTILQQAQNINTLVLGAERKTVVTLDLGLYLPAKRLQMARNDMNHLILRPGVIYAIRNMN